MSGLRAAGVGEPAAGGPPAADTRRRRSPAGRLAPHWKGHLLLFEARPPEPYGAQSGVRLLLIALLVEGVLGPRLGILGLLGLPVPPSWLRVPLLLGLVLALVTGFARLRPRHLGLRSWAGWSATERSYFLQVVVLANVVFAAIVSVPLRSIASSPARWGSAAVVLVTSLLWGFHQELVYRGLLQTELSRRWGAVAGILAANALYTFGPLHVYHFARGGSLRTGLMFAAIFAIGLFFGVLYRRSGNLWLVGIFHGIGDWYIDGVVRVAG